MMMHIRSLLSLSLPVLSLLLCCWSPGALVVCAAPLLLTIPCPGVDAGPFPMDPTSFASTVPLAERPNLARVLQHGVRPNQQQATLPTHVRPANRVKVHEGFTTTRAFRSFDDDEGSELLCPYVTCERTVSGGMTNGPVTDAFDLNRTDLSVLFRLQILLESSVESENRDYPDTLEGFESDNPSWHAWRDSLVHDFLAFPEQNCTLPDDLRYIRRHSSEYQCTVQSECQRLDPDFLADLQRLATTNNNNNNNNVSDQVFVDLFVDFLNTWGYSAVSGFDLGSVDLILSYEAFLYNATKTVLYLGRGGGGGDYLDRTSDFDDDVFHYTLQDCHDPAPIKMVYRPWHMLLLEDSYFMELEAQGLLVGRQALGFRLGGLMDQLAVGSISQQLLDSNLSTSLFLADDDDEEEECIPRTRRPTVSPAPTTSRPTSTRVPSNAPTTTPSATPTHYPTVAPPNKGTPPPITTNTTNTPTVSPSTSTTSQSPSSSSSMNDTKRPSLTPTVQETPVPSFEPTAATSNAIARTGGSTCSSSPWVYYYCVGMWSSVVFFLL